MSQGDGREATMKRVVVGFVGGVVAATVAAALALPSGQSVELKAGDNAYFNDATAPRVAGTTVCAVIAKQARPTFSCYVTGGNGRKAFGVTINGLEVTANQYFGIWKAKPYKVIFRRVQRNAFIAH